MWRCLVKKSVRVDQISNVGYGSEYRLIVANNRYKLEEKYKKEYKNIVEK